MNGNGKSKTGPAVVVGVDGSAGSNEALRWALEEARLRNVPLRALHSWIHLQALVPPLVGYPYTRGSIGAAVAEAAADVQQAPETILEKAIGELGGLDGVEVERVLVQGWAAQSLIEAVCEHDLLVVGSRGHGGFVGLLLGSVSQECAQHAPCPVVIVHAAAPAPKEQKWTSV